MTTRFLTQLGSMCKGGEMGLVKGERLDVVNWRGLGSPDRDAEREAENCNNLELSLVKSPPAVQEPRVQSLGPEDPLGGGNGNPLQYSCLENSMDRGAWPATVHGVTKSQAQLSD